MKSTRKFDVLRRPQKYVINVKPPTAKDPYGGPFKNNIIGMEFSGSYRSSATVKHVFDKIRLTVRKNLEKVCQKNEKCDKIEGTECLLVK